MKTNGQISPLLGQDNPHPFSQMKTELVWEGKCDEFGIRRVVDVVRQPS